MFDLNQQIVRRKRAFAEKRTCSQDELEELESHLRDDIAALVATDIARATIDQTTNGQAAADRNKIMKGVDAGQGPLG